jgi:predicted lipoprotein with Yx(FWY)xxD motif
MDGIAASLRLQTKEVSRGKIRLQAGTSSPAFVLLVCEGENENHIPIFSVLKGTKRRRGLRMRRLGFLLAVLALFVAACGTSDADETTTTSQAAATTTTEAPTTTAAPATTTTTEPAATGLVVTVADSSLGSILVDGEGNTLYLFIPDEQGDSVCYDQCATAWPPLPAEAVAGDGVDGGLLGSAPRTDGPEQATYNGWPLYYFASDAAPGDVNGQGVNDVWYVLDSAGNGIGIDG